MTSASVVGDRRVAAVVLAAGGSTRLGQAKQLLLDAHNETLVHRCVRDALAAGVDVVIVVVGADANRVQSAIQDLIASHDAVRTVLNDEWQSGIGSSIRAGVQAVIAWNTQVSAALLLTCDMPSVGVNHLRELQDAVNSGSQRAASAYGDTRGIPAVIPRAEFDELLQLTGDHGAKSLLMRPDTTIVPLKGGTFDLDTPADVAEWRERTGRP